MRHRVREQSRALGDALIDLYVDWREESVAVRAAYKRWCEATKDESAGAFAAYSAALDREERAGMVYAELATRLSAATRQAA